jgi:glycerate dehydrogenase
MKIVVLDGQAANPGDLSWEKFERLGDLTVYDRTERELVVERTKDAEIAITNKSVLFRKEIEQLPKLKYIGVIATGYNVVDLKAANEKGIVVTNVPAYCSDAVVELVFAHIFNLTKRVCGHAKGVGQGKWCRSIDFCYWDFPVIELFGLTMGIVGYGRIGRKVANVALAFGMKVLVNTRTVPAKAIEGIEFVDVESVFKDSDIVSLHCPLTEQTERLVSQRLLSLMKTSAFLINTGRGPLVDEEALADALNSEEIAGAGIDVLSTEPPDKNNPLLTAKNCFITPHIGWVATSARKRLLNIAAENIRAFLTGQPQNVVNKPKAL